MTEIKILIYTDTKDITLDAKDKWSVSILRDVLEAAATPFVTFSVEVVNRYQAPPQPLRIDDALLAPFDQIWLFGKYQADFDGPFDADLFGGPENELNKDEVDALQRWMTTRGMLIAGDHSDAPPDDPNSKDINNFLCLGRALGHKVRRARELRKWVGPPTSRPTSSFDTQVLLSRKASDQTQKDGPDRDAVPQQYLLELFGQHPAPHPLLIGKDPDDNDTPLDLFPDHIHEGEVFAPLELGNDWPPFDVPSEERPKPVVIARGCDKRRCESRAVLAVYDPPEAVQAGRMLADSTWHHYFNMNIEGLRDSGDDSAFRLLRQFYRHVAFFLAPLEKRQAVTGAMLTWMLSHPAVWEEKGNEPVTLGEVALTQLSGVATRYEITEMLQHVLLSKAKTDADAADLHGIDFPEASAGITALPARELVVGHFVKSYYTQGARGSEPGAVTTDASGFVESAPPDAREAVAGGVEAAFRTHEELLEKFGSATKRYLDILK